MLKKIVSMVLAITIAIAIIPLSAFADYSGCSFGFQDNDKKNNDSIITALDGTGVSMQEAIDLIADYLAIAYLAAADQNYEALQMTDLQLKVSDADIFTLCPLFYGNNKFDFRHCKYEWDYIRLKSAYAFQVTELGFTGLNYATSMFKTSCESKYIMSNVAGDLGFEGKTLITETKTDNRYVHGSIGITRGGSQSLEGNTNIDIPETCPIYSWACLAGKRPNDNNWEFNRLYYVCTMLQDDHANTMAIQQYSVSGLHLLIYIEMLHDFLSDDSTIDAVRTYATKNRNAIESYINDGSNIDVEGLFEFLDKYEFSDGSKDDLLYRAFTIATSKGSQGSWGADDCLLQASDLFGEDFSECQENIDSDYAQLRFAYACMSSATVTVAQFTDTYVTYEPYGSVSVQKTNDRKINFVCDLYKAWNNPLSSTLSGKLQELVDLTNNNSMYGGDTSDYTDVYDEFIAGSDPEGGALKYTKLLFNSFFHKGSISLNKDWLQDKTKGFWSFSRFINVLERVADRIEDWPCLGLSYQLSGDLEGYPTIKKVFVNRNAHNAPVSGPRFISASLYTLINYLEQMRSLYKAIGDTAANYQDAIKEAQTCRDYMKCFKDLGINNPAGIWWYTALLTPDDDLKDTTARIIEAIDKAVGDKWDANSLNSTSLAECTLDLLDTMSAQPKVPTFYEFLKSTILSTHKLDTSVGKGDIFRDNGILMSNTLGTFNDLFEKFCLSSGNDKIRISYLHYVSLYRKTNNTPNKLAQTITSELTTEQNPLIRSELLRLEAAYEAASNSTMNKDLKIFFKLLAISDILDFYAEQGIVIPTDSDSDSLILKVFKDCDNMYTSNISKPGIQPINRLSYHAGSFTLPYAQDVYAYQLVVCDILVSIAGYIYPTLLNEIILNGGVNLLKLQDYIQCVDIMHTLVDRYPSNYVWSLWYTPQSFKTEKYSDDVPERERITTFAALYDFLVNLGLLNGDEIMQDIYDSTNPLSIFFKANGSSVTFSKDYYKGRSLSATFLPMQTNTYDPYVYLNYLDTDWIEDFQYNYGFHRKALMIDTNVDAAVDNYVSNTSGNTRVATLKDLFNPESDIVLYVDDNYYNLQSLAEQQDKVYDRLASLDNNPLNNLLKGISNFFTDMFEVRFEVALKQDEYDTYSDRIKNGVSDLSYVSGQVDADGKPVSSAKYDDYILDTNTARNYLENSNRYTEMMGFAFVSLMYRDNGSYSAICSATAAHKPVFISSPTLATVQGVGDQQRGSIYNYALLKNLPAMCSVGANQSLDMTSPIFIDIYGNIVTESGLVVIPAACNATLHNVDSGFTPMTSGFLAAYGKEWKIPLDWNIDESFMNTFFIKNTETNEWDIRNRTINGMEIALAELSYSDNTVNQALIDWYLYDINFGSMLDKTNSLNILHEVMRGAPIENIDFDLENLNLNRTIDKSGLIAAAKLDSIINSLNWDEDNSIMSIPNLSFIDNYQYVIVIIFKILLIIIIVALMVTVYIDVMKATISGRTILKCVGILVLGVSSVLLIPVSYDLAYYQSNKALLQDEAEYILMLNTEKKMSGREIGISSVSEPKANTQIMLKLEDISFNWIECLPEVVFGDSIDVLDKKYKDYLNTSLICKEDLVQSMNDGIYVDVQDIFDTTSVIFNPDTKMLSQNVKIDPSLSYYLPYYYFLDALILNVNKFNYNNNIYAYSTKIMRGGKVGTINLVSTYFNSEWFETSTDADFLGLYQLYDVMGDMYVEDVFAEDNIEKARSSQWFVGTMMKEEERLKRCEIMNTKVREFVASHRNLIGKVTDETFLKCMAMSLSLKYNDLFGIPSASAYEVYNLSNTDLMRLTVCDKATTLEDSPMSFARFVYNEAGTPGVYASVFLVIVTMFVQTMKTIITIAIMALLIVSVFVFKILLRKQSSSIAGYFLTLLVICGTNILYALILKASLAIPQTGLAPTLCIIIQIIIQLAYLALLGIVLSFALRDWKNAGFTFYKQIGSNIKTKISNAFHKKNQTPQERYDSKPRGKDGWDYYRKLVSDNEKRIKKVGNH